MLGDTIFCPSVSDDGTAPANSPETSGTATLTGAKSLKSRTFGSTGFLFRMLFLLDFVTAATESQQLLIDRGKLRQRANKSLLRTMDIPLRCTERRRLVIRAHRFGNYSVPWLNDQQRQYSLSLTVVGTVTSRSCE